MVESDELLFSIIYVLYLQGEMDGDSDDIKVLVCTYIYVTRPMKTGHEGT